jgi:hypothetical protein
MVNGLATAAMAFGLRSSLPKTSAQSVLVFIIVAASCHHPHFTFHTSHFDALASTSTWRQALVDGATADDIVQQWEADERWFVEHRAAVLLYN